MHIFMHITDQHIRLRKRMMNALFSMKEANGWSPHPKK